MTEPTTKPDDGSIEPERAALLKRIAGLYAKADWLQAKRAAFEARKPGVSTATDPATEPDEAFARMTLAAMSAEERASYSAMNDAEMIAMLRGDFWANLDAEASDLDGLDLTYGLSPRDA